MIITCENCRVAFNLDEKRLKPTGSKVRCSKCSYIFVASPPPPEPVPEHDAKDEITDVTVKEVEDAEAKDVDLSSDIEDAEEVGEPEAEEISEEPEFSFDALDDSEVTDTEEKDDEEMSVSDLEEMLDIEDTGEIEEESEESDLSLDIGDDFETADILEEGEEKLSVSDIAENLDTEDTDEFEEGEISEELELPPDDDSDADLAKETDEDLSVSDISEMPASEDTDETEDEESSEDLELSLDDDEADTEDLELDFKLNADKATNGDLDIELETDDISDMPASDEESDREKIDLSKLEQTLEIDLLDTAPESEGDEESEDIELALSSDDGSDDNMIDADLEQDGDDDMSEIEEILGTDDEFEEDEQSAASVSATADSDQMSEDYSEEMEVPSGKKTKSAQKKKSGIWALILLGVVLLFGASFVALVLLDNAGFKIPFINPFVSGIQIPYLSDFVKTNDIKEIKLIPVKSTIQEEFVSNSKAGKLFVITGRVNNESPMALSFIEVTANLYITGGVLAKAKTIYCGNILSEIELLNSDIETINKRLLNKFGDNQQNVNIQTNSSIPFMIVISDLPDNLEEYKILVSAPSP